MKRLMVGRALIFLVIASSLTLSLCSCSTAKLAAGPDAQPAGHDDYDALLLLFKQQPTTLESNVYGAKSPEQTSNLLMTVLRSCTTVGPDTVWPAMTMILKLNETGVVDEARVDGHSTLAECMEREWVGKQYDPPPFAPFLKVVTLDANGEGGV